MSRRPPSLPTLTIALAGLSGLAYFLFLRSKMLHWGASLTEARRPYPGDDLIPHPIVETTRAITIHAPARAIWPWLVQMGQGRGGFYSYDWLENLLGMDIHNAAHVLPEFQRLQVGDLIPFWKGVGVRVLAIHPEQTLALAGSLVEDAATPRSVGGTWVFQLCELGPTATRLIVHSRIASFPPTFLSLPFTRFLLEPSHFIMERGMLLGIKRRVEGHFLSWS